MGGRRTVSSRKAGFGAEGDSVGVSSGGVRVGVGGGAVARVRVGGAGAAWVGRPNGVSVDEASGVAAGSPGVAVGTEAQALIAITRPIKAMRIREGLGRKTKNDIFWRLI